MQFSCYGKVPGYAEFIRIGSWSPLESIADAYIETAAKAHATWTASAQLTNATWDLSVCIESSDSVGRRYPLVLAVRIADAADEFLCIPYLWTVLAIQGLAFLETQDESALQIDLPLERRRALHALQSSSVADIHGSLPFDQCTLRLGALTRAVETGDRLIAVPHVYSFCEAQFCLLFASKLRFGSAPQALYWRCFEGVSAHDLAWSWDKPSADELGMLAQTAAGPGALQVAEPQLWQANNFNQHGSSSDLLQELLAHVRRIKQMKSATTEQRTQLV